ncbi:MAG: stage II sporulation protein R [Clostridia bacterium]|nr:stage II sporulation protein R [Clostridia bacterium]
MKNFKTWIILIILICIYTLICAFTYVKAVSSELKDSVFRLHVIANSDSDEDQNLKYIVRDSLLNYMNEICKGCTTKAEAIEVANSNKDEFKRIAENTIKNEGFSYDVNVSIGEFDFPTKQYGDISLPAGLYDALRVEIGEAQGHNWWCVMFPPLCFVDISSGVVPDSSKELLKDELGDEEFALISENEDSDVHFKFKLLELFSNANLTTSKK